MYKKTIFTKIMRIFGLVAVLAAIGYAGQAVLARQLNLASNPGQPLQYSQNPIYNAAYAQAATSAPTSTIQAASQPTAAATTPAATATPVVTTPTATATTSTATSTPSAVSLKFYAPPANVKVGGMAEFLGTITAMSGTTITVEGVQVNILPSTQIKGVLAINSPFEVDGILQSNGSYNAVEIKYTTSLDNDAPNSSPVLAPAVTVVVNTYSSGVSEFDGVISAINGNTLTIGGLKVNVMSNTQVVGTLAVGSAFEVDGTKQPDGSYNAIEIKFGTTLDHGLHNPTASQSTPAASAAAMPGSKAEFLGVITAMTSNTVTINGMTFNILSNTQIDGTLAVGSEFEVDGILQSNGSYNAIEIKYSKTMDNDM